MNNEAEESQAEVLHLSYSLRGYLDLQGIEILPFHLSKEKTMSCGNNYQVIKEVKVTIKMEKKKKLF